jgi:hypothetical protein
MSADASAVFEWLARVSAVRTTSDRCGEGQRHAENGANKFDRAIVTLISLRHC